ncbi:MAG: hypothetical protein ACK5K7_02410 [Bacilli bacterium]
MHKDLNELVIKTEERSAVRPKGNDKKPNDFSTRLQGNQKPKPSVNKNTKHKK